MSPRVKFTKQEILHVAVEIAKEEGISAISVRRIAENLKCSVAPIYVNYASMDALIADVVQVIFQETDEMTKQAKGTNSFEKIGYASFEFASKYPKLFRELALQPNPYMASYDQVEEGLLVSMRQDSMTEGFSDDQLRVLLFNMRVFQLGLSAMIANHMIPTWLSMEKVEEMMIEQGYQLMKQLKENQE